MKIFRIGFVCSGNICRSPMAEYMLKSMLPAPLRNTIKIKSAGTLGIIGAPAADEAIKVLGEIQIDLLPHSSRGVDMQWLKNMDLVLVMAQEHLDFVQEHYPQHSSKSFRLREFGIDDLDEKSDYDIADPVGLSLDVFREIREEINNELLRILPILSTKSDERNSHASKKNGWLKWIKK